MTTKRTNGSKKRKRPERAVSDAPPMKPSSAIIRASLWKRVRAAVGHRLCLVLVAGVAIFHTLTMPAQFYAGDNFASRLEAANWVDTGVLGIDYERRPEIASLLQERGQYFYENDTDKRFFSKYGIGHTLLYAIPYATLKAIGYPVGVSFVFSDNRAQMLALNIYQIALSAMIVAYLYLLAGLFDSSPKRRALWTLFVVYATFVWHYLRAPTHEIYQILPFAGVFYHAIRFSRKREHDEAEGSATRGWTHCTLVFGYIALLMTMKLSHTLLVPPLAVFVFFTGPRDFGWRARIISSLRLLPRFLLHAGTPLAMGGLLILATNQYRFESVFHSGYGQWLIGDGLPHDRFGLKYVAIALPRFLFRGGNANVFINAPILLLALAASVRFAKKWPKETALIAFVFFSQLALISTASFYAGEWCYGPRYLIMVAIVGALPALEILALADHARRRMTRILLQCVIWAVMIGSWTLQVHVNSLEYFAYHRLQGILGSIPDREVTAYAQSRTAFHRGLFYRDLSLYRHFDRPFPPLARLETIVPPAQKAFLTQFRRMLDQLTEPNLYLFRQ